MTYNLEGVCLLLQFVNAQILTYKVTDVDSVICAHVLMVQVCDFYNQVFYR
jgi:hypothetical protein